MSVYHKASPGEKLSRNATDEGSREAAWNKRYRNAEHKDLIRRLRRHLPQGEGLRLALRHGRTTNGRPYYIVTTKILPARVILEWRTAALQILRYARE